LELSVFGSQQDATNIEKGFAPGHKNIHFCEKKQSNTSPGHLKAEAPTKYKKAIEADSEFKKVPLDPRVPDRVMCIGAETGQQERAELLSFLDKNSDVFAWSTSDLVGVSKDMIEHRLHVNPSGKPKN
jgi:hypothetical protein